MFFIAQSCKSPTAPSSNRLSLTVEDVSCTEAWLKLTLNNIPLPTNIEIKKNGSSFLSFNLASEDTTLYDSTLLPNQTYSYQASYGRGFATEKSETISAKTMDTTSNNFMWQTFTFGVGGDNSLNDVAIINDTSIWAVGKFSIQDSGTYNAAHWDGEKWNMERIYYPYQGQNYFSEIKSIFAFSENDIWVGMNQPMHWNGVKWKTYDLESQTWNGWINKIWAQDSNDVYIAGANGELAHYDGKAWQKIQSGTTLNIQDIWGVTDPATGNEIIICIASNIFTADGNALLQIKNNQAQSISNQGLPPYYFSSIWFKNSRIAYIGGSGDFKSYNFLDKANWNPFAPKITPYYTNSIRGNDVNDIIFCGSYGDIAHYNGVRWQDYLGNELQSFYGELQRVSIRHNTVCAVGYGTINSSEHAVIVLGKRN